MALEWLYVSRTGVQGWVVVLIWICIVAGPPGVFAQ